MERRKFVFMGFLGAAASSIYLKKSYAVEHLPNSDSLGSFRQPMAGGVARLLSERLEDSVSVKDFGAVGDGVADDTVAIQASLQCGRSVLVPKGIYRIRDTVRAGAVVIHGEGAQSILLFDSIGNGKNGIEFEPEAPEQTCGCRDLAILITGGNALAAIKTPFDKRQYSDFRSKFIYSGLLIAGFKKPAALEKNAFETLDGWAVGIEQGDAWQVEISSVVGYSNYRSDKDPSGQLKSAFIRLNAAETMLTAQIKNITCSNWYRGIEIGERCFFDIQSFDIAHAYDGVFQVAVGKNVYGESRLVGGNINAQHVGIYFSGIATREVSGVIIRRHRYGWKGADYDWIGIQLESCSGVWLSNCMVQPDQSNGPFSGRQSAIALVKCASIQILGFLVGSGCQRGVVADNCVMLMLDGTVTWQSASAEDVLFELRQNTRNSVIGAYSLVSSFKGKPFVDDGSLDGALRFLQRDVNPSGHLPSYSWRRKASAKDEKIWRAAQGERSWSLMAVNDLEDKSVNALIFTRQETTVTSCEIRSEEVVMPTVRPSSDGRRSLGTSDFRWSQVYLSSAPIVTSDERVKGKVGVIDDLVLDAWAEVEYCQYKFTDAIAESNDRAKWHFGVIAQKVKSAFELKGLNAFEYGLLSYEVDVSQREDNSGGSFGSGQVNESRYGVRYEEALVLEAALMRRTVAALQLRLKKLEVD